MYGFPRDFEASCFIGKKLEQISFSENTIHLCFDPDLSITLMSSYEHYIAADQSPIVGVVPVDESTLMRLIGRRVVSAVAAAGGVLVLHFEDTQILKCLDDSPQYESYRITFRGVETVV